ncbi:hypothetical protein Ssi03_64630 [Sphaerisporangium siamense]|nr:hypothetical protein Ssi03_64630 [Sphaerisporangium siamense]
MADGPDPGPAPLPGTVRTRESALALCACLHKGTNLEACALLDIRRNRERGRGAPAARPLEFRPK